MKKKNAFHSYGLDELFNMYFTTYEGAQSFYFLEWLIHTLWSYILSLPNFGSVVLQISNLRAGSVEASQSKIRPWWVIQYIFYYKGAQSFYFLEWLIYTLGSYILSLPHFGSVVLLISNFCAGSVEASQSKIRP